MLRSSLAAAGSSAAASSSKRSAALAHAGCSSCITSIAASQPSSSALTLRSRAFTSSALNARGKNDSGYIRRLEKGEPSPGFIERWSSRKDSSPRNDNIPRLKGGKFVGKGRFQQQSKNPPKVDFSIPEPPTAQQVGRKLVEKLTAMTKDPKLPSQLADYGIKGRPAQALLQHHTKETHSERRRPSEFSAEASSASIDSATAIKLFRTWAEEAKDQIPTLALLHDRGERAHVEIFAYISDAVSSYTIEGDECLGRLCTSAFLDWVDRGFESLSTSSASLNLTAAQIADISLTRSQLSLLRNCMDLRFPFHRYARARTLTRNIHLHVGPTNSGKTHGALVALSKARTGAFAGPLRLLAHEVWDRFNNGTVSPGVAARACNLVTGEEQRTVDPLAGLVSSTVEMVSTTRAVDVGVVDEIQMIGDPRRGFAWTNAVLGLQAKELHLCGEASVIPLVQNLAKACGDHLTIHSYDRLTPLKVADESIHDDLGQIQKGDCIVAFSRSAIFALKRDIEKRTGLRCAVAYGALPPETKSEQAKLFNQGKLDVMVASDAIGMGLNLRIKRVIFDAMTKWNGKEEVTLSASQIKQIAGRAGRYGTQDKATDQADLGGIVTTRQEHELEILRAALASPLLPITKAAVQPNSEALTQLSTMLPGKAGSGGGLRTLSQIYADVSLLSRIDSTNFFLSDFSQQLTILPLIESASGGLLTVAEREIYSNAPANTRDERVVAFLCKAVSQFSRGGLIAFDDAAKDLSMLEIENEVVSLMNQAIDARNRASSANQSTKINNNNNNDEQEAQQLPLVAYINKVSRSNNKSSGNGDGDGGMVGGSAAHPLINITTLLMLESLHRCFSLYLWLSFRFPLAFCYRSEVDRRKKGVEEAIDFVLQGIRFGRAKRLQALGRAVPTHKIRS
ncbi:related to SUV3 - ATP-dependent RNA helicase, mitochondrial [Melanopsichium pennsylvanicum]|uniref:ATP-dependent RNA helicase SUV3, mitochondrial n=1 Tax=Melanopsichium pennsylvanicum TaxID=63383 RepID=A0AAJ5C7E5_9BASI|nr:related to SUV3 - ATP-dependent RNA helicase, mitochondrial [Melanopsichium pennsylvanicum]